jgi:pSer/pThr/pTyr-binding forkhead associated (FHA) protein
VTNLSLEIVEGPGAGRQQPLASTAVIGRAPDAELVLEDRQVSRHHARITPAGAGALLEDLESSNGTFVNGHELHAPTSVGPRDEIRLGLTVLELRTRQDIEARPSVMRPVPPLLAVPQREPSYVSALDLTDGQADETPALDRLRDIHTKGQAKMAPLAIFVLVTLVVLVYLATR